MKKMVMLILFGTFFCNGLLAQNYVLSGCVLGDLNNPVAGATLKLVNTRAYASTDSLGNFSFQNLASNSYQIVVSAVGYHSLKKNITVNALSNNVVFVLQQHPHLLKEVNVKSEADEQRKKEESLNLEIIKPEFVQRNLGGSLMQTLQRLPGVKTIGIGSGQSKPLIRGLGFNRVVVVDKGVKHEGQQWGADHGLEIDQFATGDIEILKGSASFAYGSDAIAGVINIKPSLIPTPNAFGGDINLIGKSNNGLYGTSVRLFKRSEKLFFDARATYQNYGDYRVPTDQLYVYDFPVSLYNNYLRNTAGRENNLHFNAGFIGERIKSIFYVSNSYSRSGFFANAHGLEPRRVNTELHDASYRDILMPSQNVNHFKVINKTSLMWYHQLLELELGYQKNFREEYNHYVNHGFMPATYPESLSIPIDLERGYDKDVYSVNFKDQINMGQHYLQLGFNSEIQQNKIYGWSFLVPSFDQQTFGLYAYDKWKLNDKVLLHGAVRYDFANLHLKAYTDWFPSKREGNSETYLQRADDLNRSFNSFVWSLGANYNLKDVEIKVNVGKSFRIPIAKELGANGVNYHYFSYEKGNGNLNPEKSYQLDFSIGYSNEKLTVRLSPFFNYFPNYIYLNPTAQVDYFYGAGNQIFNYAQSEVFRYGGEAQLKYNFLAQFSAEVLAEYLYATQLSGEKKGFTLPFSPPPSALFTLNYTPKILLGLANSYFSLDFRKTASQNNIVPPERKTKGYHLFNLQAGTKINLGHYNAQISFQAQNVFNTKYLNHTSFYRLIGLPEQGRNFILSLKIPFHSNP